jgi:hypothetical protein
MNGIEILTAASNGFGKTGVLDRFGNVVGIVLAVFGIIMIVFSFKVRKLGGFILEMENHDPIIKETGYTPASAKVGKRRSSEIAGKTFSEMQLLFELDGETYVKWTPDLGLDGEVQIEYNPKNPGEFYICEKIEAEESPDMDEDGTVVEDLKEPPNKVFYAMLVFGIILLGLGCGFLYDFYFIK